MKRIDPLEEKKINVEDLMALSESHSKNHITFSQFIFASLQYKMET